MSAVKSYSPCHKDAKLVSYCAEFGYCYPCYKIDSQDPVQLIPPGVCPICSCIPRVPHKKEIVWSKEEEARVSYEFSIDSKNISTEALVKSLELINKQLEDKEFEPLYPQIRYWQRILMDEMVIRRLAEEGI